MELSTKCHHPILTEASNADFAFPEIKCLSCLFLQTLKSAQYACTVAIACLENALFLGLVFYWKPRLPRSGTFRTIPLDSFCVIPPGILLARKYLFYKP